MKRGLVVEKDGQTVVVLTPDGRFLKVKKKWANVELGSEITFEDSWPIRHIPYGRLVPVLMLALLVMAMAGLMDLWEHEVHTYISLGPEPKVEFGVNRLNRVVEIIPQSMDPSLLGMVSACYGQPVDKVLRKLMAVPQDKGAVQLPMYYVVTTPATGLQEMTIETAALRSDSSTLPLQQVLPSALILTVPADVRDEAARLGVFPGDYAVYWLYTQSGGAMEQLARFVQ